MKKSATNRLLDVGRASHVQGSLIMPKVDPIPAKLLYANLDVLSTITHIINTSLVSGVVPCLLYTSDAADES